MYLLNKQLKKKSIKNLKMSLAAKWKAESNRKGWKQRDREGGREAEAGQWPWGPRKTVTLILTR